MLSSPDFTPEFAVTLTGRWIVTMARVSSSSGPFVTFLGWSRLAPGVSGPSQVVVRRSHRKPPFLGSESRMSTLSTTAAHDAWAMLQNVTQCY